MNVVKSTSLVFFGLLNIWLFLNPEDLPQYANLLAAAVALIFAIIAAGEKVVIRIIDAWDKVRDYLSAKKKENQEQDGQQDTEKKEDEL